MRQLSFQSNLKDLRLLKGYTQKRLGELLCVDQRTVSAWEKGVCEPSFSMLLAICELFDESAENLLFNQVV